LSRQAGRVHGPLSGGVKLLDSAQAS
jgi:hypothetical protein